TVFGVREDEGAGVVVAVTEGSVRVTTATDSGVVLNAGRAVTVSMDGRVRPRAEAATPADLAWATGELVFRDAPMARVQADLRRWYGVVLLVPQPELAQRRLTATFRRDSREQVLTVLSLSLGATYEVRGDTAVLRSRAAR
ncbi:MAG: DUF4974 domain-containing protein, partial [Gemmatimonadota bacterium]|nr:DUF4974 domain-containing protein [Gemmatimonadota bacterium]